MSAPVQSPVFLRVNPLQSAIVAHISGEHLSTPIQEVELWRCDAGTVGYRQGDDKPSIPAVSLASGPETDGPPQDGALGRDVRLQHVRHARVRRQVGHYPVHHQHTRAESDGILSAAKAEGSGRTAVLEVRKSSFHFWRSYRTVNQLRTNRPKLSLPKKADSATYLQYLNAW